MTARRAYWGRVALTAAVLLLVAYLLTRAFLAAAL